VRGCASELQGCFSRHWLDVRHSANAVSSKDLFLLRHGVIETLEWSFVNGKLLSIVIATSKRYWWIVESRLDFGAIFYLDRSVPADDRVTSLTGVGGSAQNGAVAFATAHWSVVLTAQDQTPESDAALEKLCRIYWWPLYGFVRRQGYGPEEAQDLTQGFFALVLERRDFDAVRREKGRLRSYLLVSLKNFVGTHVVDCRRRTEFQRSRGRGSPNSWKAFKFTEWRR
jgi:hypothetical protein